MKNVVKSMALASMIALTFACKNDTSASANNTAAASISGVAPTSNEVVAPATPTAALTEANKPAENVAPSAGTPANPTPSAKPAGKTTSVKFEEMSYDWGKIKEGDKMTHIFKFKNTGNEDLIISDARGSCGCTVPEWPKEPIKAGKGGEIKVVFDSDHKAGPQSKTVTITANTDPSSIVLMIKGIVDAKEEAKTN